MMVPLVKTSTNTAVDLVLANPEDVKANYYFSILAPDSKGQVLKLAEIFNAQDISFKQILQDGKEGDKARVVIITHKINNLNLKMSQLN